MDSRASRALVAVVVLTLIGIGIFIFTSRNTSGPRATEAVQPR
ncbi:MAG: hypothetical protein ABW106_02025 [Steroidobacteraceae bacterium]